MRSFIPTISLAVAVSAQSISLNCQNALAAVATNPDASACLNPSALVQLVIGGSNSSIISPINNWLTGMCASGPCSNTTIANVVTNITSGCSAELSSAGLTTTSDSSQAIVSAVQAAYPTVRQVLCLSDSGTNCVTETLTNIQNVNGQLTFAELLSIIANPTNASLPANVTCTNCTKAAYNIINQNFPSLVSGEASAVQSQCGSSFTDGSTPSGIVETASTSAASNSGAVALLFSTGGLLGLMVSAMVALLAPLVLMA